MNDLPYRLVTAILESKDRFGMWYHPATVCIYRQMEGIPDNVEFDFPMTYGEYAMFMNSAIKVGGNKRLLMPDSPEFAKHSDIFVEEVK